MENASFGRDTENTSARSQIEISVAFGIVVPSQVHTDEACIKLRECGDDDE